MRGTIARRLFGELLRQHRASIVIQKHARRHATCRAYYATKQKIVVVQSGMSPYHMSS